MYWMGGMFEYAESFNQPLNKWNVFTYFPGTCQMWTTCMCLMVQPPSISRSMLLGTGNSQMLVNNWGVFFFFRGGGVKTASSSSSSTANSLTSPSAGSHPAGGDHSGPSLRLSLPRPEDKPCVPIVAKQSARSLPGSPECPLTCSRYNLPHRRAFSASKSSAGRRD